MDTSNLETSSVAKHSNLLDFLARNSNIAGSLSAILAGAVGFIATSSSVLAVGVGLVAYAAGYLCLSPGKKSISVGDANEEVEILTLQGNAAKLKADISSHAKNLPDDIILETGKLFDILEEILPKWNKLQSFSEQKYTVNAILTDYLPKIITNYMNLPKSYYRNAEKNKVAAEVLEQVKILYTALQAIRDGLYEGVENDIKTQGVFLKEKFVNPSESFMRLK